MARKTDKQLLLEAKNPGKSIREILVETLEKHRAEPHLVEVAANELGVSKGTMGIWCRENDIAVEDFKYRFPSTTGAQVGQQ
jgi:hypothetical protein